jgi:hypothetical protein
LSFDNFSKKRKHSKLSYHTLASIYFSFKRSTTFNDRQRSTINNVQRSTTFNDQQRSTINNVQRSTQQRSTINNVQRSTTFNDQQRSTINNVQRSTTFNDQQRSSFKEFVSLCALEGVKALCCTDTPRPVRAVSGWRPQAVVYQSVRYERFIIFQRLFPACRRRRSLGILSRCSSHPGVASSPALGLPARAGALCLRLRRFCWFCATISRRFSGARYAAPRLRLRALKNCCGRSAGRAACGCFLLLAFCLLWGVPVFSFVSLFVVSVVVVLSLFSLVGLLVLFCRLVRCLVRRWFFVVSLLCVLAWLPVLFALFWLVAVSFLGLVSLVVGSLLSLVWVLFLCLVGVVALVPAVPPARASVAPARLFGFSVSLGLRVPVCPLCGSRCFRPGVCSSPGCPSALPARVVPAGFCPSCGARFAACGGCPRGCS